MINQRNVLLSLIVFLVLAAAFVRGQVSSRGGTVCTGVNNALYSSNSTYETNLQTLLNNLPANVGGLDGFYTNSSGQTPDAVTVATLCRGDVQLDVCRSCIQDATTNILSRTSTCWHLRWAILYSDFCTLRYSDQPLFDIMDTSNGFTWSSDDNVTSPDTFTTDLMTLIDDLRGQASNGSFSSKVAAGNRSTSDHSQTIYALVQCSPNLVPRDCVTCLRAAAIQLPIAAVGRSFMPTCNIQYGLTYFYNETRLQELAQRPNQRSQEGSSTSTPTSTNQQGSNTPTVDNQLASGPETSQGGSRNATTQIIIIVVVLAVVGSIALVAGILIKKGLCRTRKMEDSESDSNSLVNKTREHGLPIQFFPKKKDSNFGKAQHLHLKFKEIKTATNDFSEQNVIGQGGFGKVYKGSRRGPDGPEIIAVKKLIINPEDEQHRGDGGFKAEIETLAELRHANLVRLVGFASEGTDKLLVYEYLENGSLSKFLFGGATGNTKLDWKQRYKIIRGIVKGIVYLHNESGRESIIHRDLKPDNILLDKNMEAKIADFGLARLLELNQTHYSTMHPALTPGYAAPEGNNTCASDIYSFGVLLLEIISGQRNITGHAQEVPLLSKVRTSWNDQRFSEVVDEWLIGDRTQIPNDILMCIKLGMLCVERDPECRPKIGDVTKMLDDAAGETNSLVKSWNTNQHSDFGKAQHLHREFHDIKTATSDFSTEIGHGGFGKVYKGSLPGQEIAVKKLIIHPDANRGDGGFKAEIETLAQLRHTNLVQLVGFSSKGPDKLLVYEYLQNGSLSKFLFAGPTGNQKLDWKQRYKIIRGIVKGIVYLHNESGGESIIHRDLKPDNILLDAKMEAKIADFGLARLLELDKTHCSTNSAVGTPGYVAPEGNNTRESDIYSFGVLLLEIISGEKNRIRGVQVSLLSRVWACWHDRTCLDVVDKMLIRDRAKIPEAILKCINIGLLCVQSSKKNRPNIDVVAQMLDGSVDLKEPSSPPFDHEYSFKNFHTAY